MSPEWPIVFCECLCAIATHSNIASLKRGEHIHYCIVRLKGVRSSPHKVNRLSGMGQQLLLCMITDLISACEGWKLSVQSNKHTFKKKPNRIRSQKA